jgi:hypothetical protein
MVELYLHSSLRLHDMVLNQLSPPVGNGTPVVQSVARRYTD